MITWSKVSIKGIIPGVSNSIAIADRWVRGNMWTSEEITSQNSVVEEVLGSMVQLQYCSDDVDNSAPGYSLRIRCIWGLAGKTGLTVVSIKSSRHSSHTVWTGRQKVVLSPTHRTACSYVPRAGGAASTAKPRSRGDTGATQLTCSRWRQRH